MPLDQLCAWRDCSATCPPVEEALPPGWVYLVTFRETESPRGIDWLIDIVLRDAVLCPVHADGLEDCLKKIRPVER